MKLIKEFSQNLWKWCFTLEIKKILQNTVWRRRQEKTTSDDQLAEILKEKDINCKKNCCEYGGANLIVWWGRGRGVAWVWNAREVRAKTLFSAFIFYISTVIFIIPLKYHWFSTLTVRSRYHCFSGGWERNDFSCLLLQSYSEGHISVWKHLHCHSEKTFDSFGSRVPMTQWLRVMSNEPTYRNNVQNHWWIITIWEKFLAEYIMTLIAKVFSTLATTSINCESG
jgi:hypothetical protein